MELMIYSPGPEEKLPDIQWNFEEIKKYAAERAAYYSNIAYTDADAADMKKDKAAMNKFINAMESARKQKKKEYLAPYEVFELQVKETLLPLRKAIEMIDSGLEEIEQQYRVDKKKKMEEIYKKHVGDLAQFVPFPKTIREEYYKRAFTDKKLEQAYIDFFERIHEEMGSLEELPERFRDKATLRYMESFSLSEALREGKRLEELEKVMEERRKKQEEAAAKELQKKEVEKTAAEIPEKAKFGPAHDTAGPKKPIQKPVMTLDFRVWGTSEQLMGLRKYMIDNGIKFGKVE